MLKKINPAFSLICWMMVILTNDVEAQGTREMTAASYRERGDQWQVKGEYKRAIEDYNLALVFDPESADTYNTIRQSRHRATDRRKHHSGHCRFRSSTCA